jgi:hypothetical protein
MKPLRSFWFKIAMKDSAVFNIALSFSAKSSAMLQRRESNESLMLWTEAIRIIIKRIDCGVLSDDTIVAVASLAGFEVSPSQPRLPLRRRDLSANGRNVGC